MADFSSSYRPKSSEPRPISWGTCSVSRSRSCFCSHVAPIQGARGPGRSSLRDRVPRGSRAPLGRCAPAQCYRWTSVLASSVTPPVPMSAVEPLNLEAALQPNASVTTHLSPRVIFTKGTMTSSIAMPPWPTWLVSSDAKAERPGARSTFQSSGKPCVGHSIEPANSLAKLALVIASLNPGRPRRKPGGHLSLHVRVHRNGGTRAGRRRPRRSGHRGMPGPATATRQDEGAAAGSSRHDGEGRPT
jgi:hypothetical protein